MPLFGGEGSGRPHVEAKQRARAYFGLTPRRYASGETDENGRVSKCGDTIMRPVLYEGAQAVPCCSASMFPPETH